MTTSPHSASLPQLPQPLWLSDVWEEPCLRRGVVVVIYLLRRAERQPSGQGSSARFSHSFPISDRETRPSTLLAPRPLVLLTSGSHYLRK